MSENGLKIQERKKFGNGEAYKIVWWLLITITGITVSGALFWVSGITTKMNEIDATEQTRGERITRLEEALKNLYIDLGKIDGRAAETNAKLDRLLESWYREAGPYKQRGTSV